MDKIDLNDVIVDIETAKNLREKGYDEPTNLFYQSVDLPHLTAGLRSMKNGEKLNHNRYEEFLFSAPTYREATAWLLELFKNWEFKDFDESDWAAMHDCIYNATYDTTQEDLSTDELKKLFHELPDSLKADARRWGMSDTPWRDELYTWYQKNRITA